MLSMRLDIKILEDRLNAIQERIWRLEDRYPDINRMPDTVLEEYRKLKREMEKIEKRIEYLLRQQRG